MEGGGRARPALPQEALKSPTQTHMKKALPVHPLKISAASNTAVSTLHVQPCCFLKHTHGDFISSARQKATTQKRRREPDEKAHRLQHVLRVKVRGLSFLILVCAECFGVLPCRGTPRQRNWKRDKCMTSITGLAGMMDVLLDECL